MNADTKLCAGDWVEIKQPLEIARTLDANGTLDGLAFMPEMIPFCGHRARVLRRAEKACVELRDLSYWMRAFHKNNVVVLNISRCTGADHDGCGRACVFFWKADWLRKVDPRQSLHFVGENDKSLLASRLKTKSDSAHYFCQSTEIAKATHPLTRLQIVLKCFADLRSGSRRWLEMIQLVVVPLFRYITRYQIPRPLVGKRSQTPVGRLDLQAGEWIEIKSESEILDTLDAKGRNRGMICDRGLTQYGGRKYRVRNRLDRMICEPTGEMRQMQSTILLDGLNCHCWWRRLGGCSRDDFMYWREIWVKRADATQAFEGNSNSNGSYKISKTQRIDVTEIAPVRAGKDSDEVQDRLRKQKGMSV